MAKLDTAVLLAALRPFAAIEVPDWARDDHPVLVGFNGSWEYDPAECQITAGDIRRARAALVDAGLRDEVPEPPPSPAGP